MPEEVTKTIKFEECMDFINKTKNREAEEISDLISGGDPPGGINSVKVQIATNLELYSKERKATANAAALEGDINYKDSVFIITGSSEEAVGRLINSIKTYQGGGFIKRKKKSKKKKKKKSRKRKKARK